MEIGGAEVLIRSFALATGATVELYDGEFRRIYEFGCESLRSFCAGLHLRRGAIALCHSSDNDALDRVKESGRIHSFTCPFGVKEMLAPIHRGREIIGYVFVALGFLDKGANFDAMLPFIEENATRVELMQLCDAVPRFDEERTASVLVMLNLLIASIEERGLFESGPLTLGEGVRRYVMKNLDKRITLDDICLKLHLSRATLTAGFRRELGCSVMKYVNEERMLKACTLLEGGRLSIAEIAECCGFSGADYFSAAFKRRWGVAPSLWKGKTEG